MTKTTAAARLLAPMLIAGAFATVMFDLWGQAISPMLGYARLSPDGLARSLLGTFGLPNAREHGQFVHLLPVGLIAYPLGWMLIFRPLWERFVGKGGWFVPSAIYGFGLWVFAIGGITAIAGLPFFLDFTGIAWVALVGHTLYGIALVWCLRRIGSR
ncbi:hypothetical protein [Roseobacter sp. HKCCA0434]|uniref:hypothetical protein n=1 Tax=Roseobacter sp. HKCCA0434 TaxID=3079297 RepID=UPI002905F0A1|nr:hypothetical protein [Roseobacter sp. HKCCA0434]